jgi:lipopolysaccharide/colanic/teichoic acid biosynthesis glycosyltransferase
VDAVYIRDVLPGKMKYNLDALKNFSFFSDIATMFRTVFAVLGK